jgi:xanthine dehydrogenase small subunit
MGTRDHIRFVFRGQVRRITGFRPSTTLLEWLREDERATGTKEGCNEGDCGACTVVLARLIGGRITFSPVNACILLLGQIDGAELITIEDLAGDQLHPVQAAMVKHHGAQCGFCTPGIVMSLFAAYHEAARPVTRALIDEQLSGNLCRCTGYRPIADAAFEALADMPDDHIIARFDDMRARLAALDDADTVFSAQGTGFFAAPRSLDAFADLTLRYPEARIIAGATDVGLWITKRLMPLDRIIWLGRVQGLDRIESGTDTLYLGGAATHEAALPHLAALDPDLGVLMRRFGSKQVRASGTVGGNIANGSPIGDLAPALIALGATLHLRKGGMTRRMPLEAFFLDYGKQDRDAGEFVTGISVPKLRAGQHFRALKLSKRFDEDISAVMGAFLFDVEYGQVTAARIAYGGMAATPKRAMATEAALAGVSLADPHAWAEAVAKLADDFQPISDMRASAHYRLRGARALLGKALLEIAGAPAETRITPRETRSGEANHAA